MTTSIPLPADAGAPAVIDYTNWKGERSMRNISPGPSWWGMAEPWHKSPGWLMAAVDRDTGKMRIFALAGVHTWNGESVVYPAGPEPHGLRLAARTLIDACVADFGAPEDFMTDTRDDGPVGLGSTGGMAVTFAMMRDVLDALSGNTPTQEDLIREALYRLKNECEIEGLDRKAGFDAWCAMANKALGTSRFVPLELTPHSLPNEWDGASLSVRLRSYPAVPPGEDALAVGYVCRLMREAAAAIDRLALEAVSTGPEVAQKSDPVPHIGTDAVATAFAKARETVKWSEGYDGDISAAVATDLDAIATAIGRPDLATGKVS